MGERRRGVQGRNRSLQGGLRSTRQRRGLGHSPTGRPPGQDPLLCTWAGQEFLLRVAQVQ